MKPRKFTPQPTITCDEAVRAAFVRYVGMVVQVAGQDGLDGLAFVADESFEQAEAAGMAPDEMEKLRAFFAQAAKLAFAGHGKDVPH